MLQDDLFNQSPPHNQSLMFERFDAWTLESPERGGPRKPDSIAVYRDMWTALVKWTGLQQLDLPNISAAQLDAYLRSRGGANELSPRYALRLLRLVERVLNHGARENDRPPTHAIAELLEARPELRYAEANDNDDLPDFLDAVEARALVAFLALPVRTGKWQEQRDRAAVALHMGAGLTPLEVRTLPLDAVRGLRSGTKKIRIPAGGEVAAHEAPIAPWAWSVVVRWIDTRSHASIAGPWLLPATASGREWGKTAHYDAIKALLESAGLPARGGAYRLRHTFAIRQLKRGRAPSELAGWLGIEEDAVLRYRRIIAAPVDVV